MPSLLKCGEFARLCGTTKNTLIHYDAIGLLHPARTTPNGYRWYRTAQYWDLSTIATLQQSGSSLEEIRSLRETEDPARKLALLRSRSADLRREAERLLARQRLLEAFLASAVEAQSMPFGEIIVTERPKTRIRVFGADPAALSSADDMADSCTRCIDWDVAHAEIVTPPSGLIVTQADMARGVFTPCAHFTRPPFPAGAGGIRASRAIPSPKAPPSLRTLPAGRCARNDPGADRRAGGVP